MENLKSLNRWKFFNLDRIEEILETQNKAVILICGASSSGKSFAAEELRILLEEYNLKTTVISTDNYSKGISGIICDKVNKNYFNNSLKNIGKIKEIVKNCIINTDFSEKFNKNDLFLIKNKINKLIEKNSLDLFLNSLKLEFDKINFDEPSAYDLKMVASDINLLLENKTITEKKYSKVISEQTITNSTILGENVDVILVEGIYALEDEIVNNIPSCVTVKNFIEGNSKSLFLRRIIRDSKTTSADNCFTISLYFKYIVPSYINQILPNKNKADFVFKNDMTFKELRYGDLYATKQKIEISKDILNKILEKAKILSNERQRDLYFCSETENVTEENLLRRRTIFNEKTQNYEPTSLVHKGAIKNRSDDKIIRPINLLIKEGDFFKIFKNEDDFVENMKLAQFDIERKIYKTRYRIELQNNNFTVDDIINEGIFIEFSDNEKDAVLNIIKQFESK